MANLGVATNSDTSRKRAPGRDVHPRGARRFESHTIEIWIRTLTKDQIGIVKMARIMTYLREDRGMTVETIREEMSHSAETIICKATVHAWFHSEIKTDRRGDLNFEKCRRHVLHSQTLHRFQLAFNIKFVERTASDMD